MERKYNPHAFQRKFHKSKHRIRVKDTGRQVGKSFAGMIDLAHFVERGLSDCCGVTTDIVDRKYVCPKCGKECGVTPVNCMVVAPTRELLDDVNIKMFREYIPSWFEYGWNEQKKRLTHKNGSTIRFRSADNPERLRGSTLDYLWIDEASFMKPQVWDIVKPATLVKNAIIVITTTPKGKNWVYQKFYKNAGSIWTVENPLLEAKQEPIHITRPDGDPDIEVYHYRSFDVDHIKPEDILSEKNRMSDRMYRQEWLATHEAYSGMIYPMYDESAHIIDNIPNVAMQYFVGIDVGFNNPTAILLIGEDENHNLYVIDEVYESQLLASDIYARYKSLTAGKEIRETFIDPASKQSTQASGGVSVYDQLTELGMVATLANNDVLAGINRVSELLIVDHVTNRPKLFIHRRCVNLREEIGGYVWDDAQSEKNAPERPKKFKDHACDALRYTVIGRPDWYAHEPSKFGSRPVEIGAVDLLEDRIDPDLF